MGLYCVQLTENDLHARFCRRSSCVLCYTMRRVAFDSAYSENHLTDGPPDTYPSKFCKRPLCYECRTAEEAISVHTDCFQLFEQHCTVGDGEDSTEKKDEKYRRLWLAGTRRYAWRETQPLKFPSSTTLAISPEIISKICGFKNTFLPEVARMIQSFLPSHIIWRYCSAIQLAQELGSEKAEEAITYELPKIFSWSRGSPPKLVQDESDVGSFVRIAIDHRGIRSIDRISDTPASTAGEMRASSCVFAVEPIEKLSDAKIEFELGLGRLQIPAELHITTWSTPNRFHLMKLMNLTPHTHHRLAAFSLDPEHCTGISFFLRKQVVREIYPHSRRHSTHVERFQYLRSSFDHQLAWIYIPLTAQDKITAIEVRKNITMDSPHHFTIWTKSGKIIVGTPEKTVRPWRTRPSQAARQPDRRILYEIDEDARRPLSLVHSIPISNFMTFIGTDADKQTETAEVDVGPQHVWPLRHAYFSSASLEEVLKAHVFSDKRRNLCKGILLEYENGSKRALGQCRLGWDRVQSWRKPLSMFFAYASYQFTMPDDAYRPHSHRSVQVTFDSESDHVDEDGELDPNFYPMKGCINFWFLVNDVKIEIVDS
ncbi:hypothetical protein V8C42DRAFT_309859 [Trichoderma barbatum]